MTEQKEQKLIAAALKALERKKLMKAFDAFRMDSRPNKKQDIIFQDMGKIQYRYVVAGNQSGKSALAAREIAWILTDSHPYWKRPEDWQDEPLLILMAGQDLTMMATELWGKKIMPFLDPSEWRQEKQGNTLKRVINKNNGDQIVFLSHSDSSDKNRKHMQGYTAHYVWLDEMPSSVAILEELQLRVQSKRGFFISTFTPKFRSDKIRKMVDGSVEPYAKKYRMSKFDNPIFANSYKEEMARLASFSESERNTILYGDWSTGDNAVYRFDMEQMTVDAMPAHYNSGWRHVVAVDPALRSKCGYTLWAEDPNSGTWYLVDDRYIEGSQSLEPYELYSEVIKRSSNYNIHRRISDSMAWFTSVASKHGTPFMIPYDKNSRKAELIKGLQNQLSSGKIKIGKWCGAFVDEIQSCQFREDSEKLVNSSSYHTLDCAQYFCDMIPVYNPSQAQLPWQETLLLNHRKNLKEQSRKIQLAKSGKGMVRKGRPVKGWSGRRGLRVK